MRSIRLIFILLVLFACKQTPKITEWRGPSRDGIYPETNLLKSWPDSGPALVWETEIAGNGYSSPVVTDQYVFFTGEIDSLGYLFQFDHQGREISRMTYEAEWTTNFTGPRGTPTLVDQLAYICSGQGEVVCLDTEKQIELWRKNLVADFGGISPRFGFSEALLIDQEKVYCLAGGEAHNLVALNRYTGQLMWSSPCRGERPAYCSAKLIEAGGKKIIVTFSAYHLLGVDAETGQLLWSHEQTNTRPEEREPGNGDTHGNTVLFDDHCIYYAEGDGNGGVKLKLNEEATGFEQVWQTVGFDNYMTGIVKWNNRLYGSSHSKKQLMAVDCETGEKTDSLNIGRGNVILADGMICFYNDQGMVYLVRPAADGMEVAGSFKLIKGTREHFAHPVIHRGVLYLRHGNYLGAYQIGDKT